MECYDDCSSSSSSSNEHSHLLPRPSSASSSSPRVVPSPSPKRKAGRKKFKETRHPIYRGVRERNRGKWVCEVREPNKKTRIWLGTYPTPEMAARAHDVAAMALRGKSAMLNFEDSAWLLPRARSCAADDIRSIASEAAQMFRPAATSPRKLAVEPSKYSMTSDDHGLIMQQVARERPPSPPPPPPVAMFVDEEALYNMPGLLKEMAEGLMLTPPGVPGGGGGGGGGGLFDQDAGECHMDMSLWTN